MYKWVKMMKTKEAIAIFVFAVMGSALLNYVHYKAFTNAENRRREQLVKYTKQNPYFRYNDKELLKWWWAVPQGKGIAEGELTPLKRDCWSSGCTFYFKEENDTPVLFYSANDPVVMPLSGQYLGNNLDYKIAEFDNALKRGNKMRVVLESPSKLSYFGKLPESVNHGYGPER